MSDFSVKVSYGATLNSTVGNAQYEVPPKGEATTSGEFERFETLAAKLIAVPKTELDKKRGKS